MAREEEGRGSTTVPMPVRRRPLTSQPSCRTCCSRCRLASRPCPSPSLPRSTRWDRASTSWSGASVSSSRRRATPTPSLLRRPSPLTRSCEEGAPPQNACENVRRLEDARGSFLRDFCERDGLNSVEV